MAAIPSAVILEHYFTSVWDECNCAVVWAFFGIALLWDWNENCGHCWVFQICWHFECSTFTASSFRIWNSSTEIPSPPLALFIVMLPKVHLTSHLRMSGSRWVIILSWWTVVLEKTLENPLDCKDIQPVHPKGDQAWVFIGRTDVEAETPILWPPDAKSWLIWKNPDAGKDWGQEEKATTDDEMFGWYHRLNTWLWVDSGSWWWTGRPGVLWFMRLQRVGHDWATTELMNLYSTEYFIFQS